TINFISDAWNDVSDTIIKNCWKATRIILETSELNEYREEEDRQESSQENELEDVISKVDDDVDMLVEDFLIENNLDEGIIEMVNYEFRDDNDENDDNNDDEPSPPPPITITKATEALKKVIKFQESLEVRKGFNERN
ncbi:34994_t:CDS:2, partial [Gigaspora margarita]